MCPSWFLQMPFCRLSVMRVWELCGTGPSPPCCWCWTLPSSSWFMKVWRGSWREEVPGRWARKKERLGTNMTIHWFERKGSGLREVGYRKKCWVRRFRNTEKEDTWSIHHSSKSYHLCAQTLNITIFGNDNYDAFFTLCHSIKFIHIFLLFLFTKSLHFTLFLSDSIDTFKT